MIPQILHNFFRGVNTQLNSRFPIKRRDVETEPHQKGRAFCRLKVAVGKRHLIRRPDVHEKTVDADSLRHGNFPLGAFDQCRIRFQGDFMIPVDPELAVI